MIQQLHNYCTTYGMKEGLAVVVLRQWMLYPGLFDLLQSWRKKYGDRDLSISFTNLRLWELVEMDTQSESSAGTKESGDDDNE